MHAPRTRTDAIYTAYKWSDRFHPSYFTPSLLHSLSTTTTTTTPATTLPYPYHYHYFSFASLLNFLTSSLLHFCISSLSFLFSLFSFLFSLSSFLFPLFSFLFSLFSFLSSQRFHRRDGDPSEEPTKAARCPPRHEDPAQRLHRGLLPEQQEEHGGAGADAAPFL